MTSNSQDPDKIAEVLLDKQDGEKIVLHLDDGTELPVSIRRPLHLPSSVDDDVDGGSLRYAVEADDDAVNRLDLPDPEGLVAAEEVAGGSWNRSRVEFREIEHSEDDTKEFGAVAMAREIEAVDV
ncbi:hypothetical protein [Halopiger aswanensis]|uniref:Uncharacterized protein n=1 Tax=Halopiger aswanensis TaxID=148449 RepID=A0A419VUW9_9EURY|nr:hypothetical protein [Halopiger aswanensis]RKD85915.1 hypothetical protein ATJ93_4687 [Halopiger aswanensis]